MNRCVEEAVEECRYPAVAFSVDEPPRPEYGDLSANVAFQIATATKEPPMKVAEKIAGKIRLEGRYLISSFSADPPGYLNFRIRYPEFAQLVLKKALTEEKYGTADIGRGERVIVEHTSVNPNKALHIGHLRNLVLGDSVARILRFIGHDVKVLNYIDDSGVQVADIIVGFLHAGFSREPPPGVKFDHYCGDTVYVNVNEMYGQNPTLLEKQRQVLREMEDGSSETARLAREITERILREQLKTCWRVGARYDCLNFETHILETRLWEEVFQLLKEKGITRLADSGRLKGCWIVEVEGEEEGEEKVLVRADGTVTYMAKDIPYAAWKIGLVPDRFRYRVFTQQPGGQTLWATTGGAGVEHPVFASAHRAVTVIDVRQSRLQRMIQRILSEIADEDVSRRYVHLGYAVVSLSQSTAKELGLTGDRRFMHMSGRKGVYINADDLLDVLHSRSHIEARSRNPEESEEWLNETAENVAVSAVRFDLLRQDLDKMIAFDLNEALKLEGQTGPYLLYSHARAARILEKAGVFPDVTLETASTLESPYELSLVKGISKFDLVVEEASVNLAPKVLTGYAFQLAEDFNVFYEKVPVLKAEGDDVRGARLALVRAFKVTLKNALELLGIPVPDRI